MFSGLQHQRSPYRATAGAPTEPPPPYSEAVAWSPSAQRVSNSPVVHRPTRPTPVHSDSSLKPSPRRPAITATPRPISAQELPPRLNTQYDGLTGRRTRHVPSPHRPPLPAVDPSSRTRTGNNYDGLTGQHYPARPRSTTTPDSLTSTVAPSLPPGNAARASSSTTQPRASGRGPITPPAREPGPSQVHPSHAHRPVPSQAPHPSAPRSTSSPASRPDSGTPISRPESNAPPRPSRPDDRTDLDALLARIEHSREPEYADLTLLADFLGPALPPPSIDALGIPAGTVELVRRRVTRDGRVKLRLQLLGAAVERCSACLAQFRAGDAAAVLQPCAHAVHAECARKWLARSATCPMCRHRLDADGE